MPTFVLGVDGGGTKTTAILLDRGGSVLGRGQAGPSNRYAVGDATAGVELRRAIEAALERGNVAAADVRVICLGMAGVDRPGDSAAVTSVVRGILPAAEVLVHNDALIALAGGVGRLYGVVLIAGTGAIAYGVDAQRHSRRASGWGHLLGDEGSGYDIGLRALRAVLRAHDGRGPATTLTARVLSAWNLNRPEDLIGLVYAPDFPRRRIASLLPLVDEAVGAGDAVARELLVSAGHELGQAACAVIRGLGMEQEVFEVVLAGGAFQTRHLLRDAVDETVRALAPRAVLIEPRHEPAMGAALLALQLATA
ncbi:MAG: BadF/BadG/BcrA/BcrD ATPase family protein [Chloroflexota bacterium]|nr:BadF/BadG/BcrA/BcrD ATPase family protein [Chloroflexota bacterium]